MSRRGPLVQTLEDLREGCSAAADPAAIVDLVVQAAQRRIGLSAVSFFRIGGPVVAPGDFVALARVPAARIAEDCIDHLQRVDREILPFPEFFASEPRSFDIAHRWSADFLRRTSVFNDYWRPWGVERQLVGVLGTAAAPRGFVAVARRESEGAFAADDLRAFEEIRAELDAALDDPRAPCRSMQDTLSVLAAASDAVSLLFDPAGTLLWLTEAAAARLARGAARLGSSFAISHAPALEELRAWIRACGRAADGADGGAAPPAPRLGDPGERLALRRIDDHGRTRFLVTLQAELAPPASLASARPRAEDLARDRGLTRRQTDVLAQLATGQGNKQIAAQLGCTEKTIELHVSALLTKLACRSRTELVARFWAH